jgi:hypothetical protein
MIAPKYIPSDSEVEDFFYAELRLHMGEHIDDDDELISAIKKFCKESIERAFKRMFDDVINEPVLRTSDDQHSVSESQ